ncbi:uncharacterized protein K452DRAFT_84658 [Aplosporella prunicola CBS 121167]|uniref:Uncharacterized protein n=1 Tax=Aplosporella prunicola CBS 121167 TaxID=1176127 RepID=A0A6A6B689_9PEZI|nr:uncharacterized protein K452DRAFT_84658 [Aplosporella prunicola CBS 121167]KAF2138795.1 hypothetical protein K452DRAFT_84658 [Aplosporella prunicola CBS 121167]
MDVDAGGQAQAVPASMHASGVRSWRPRLGRRDGGGCAGVRAGACLIAICCCCWRCWVQRCDRHGVGGAAVGGKSESGARRVTEEDQRSGRLRDDRTAWWVCDRWRLSRLSRLSQLSRPPLFWCWGRGLSMAEPQLLGLSLGLGGGFVVAMLFVERRGMWDVGGGCAGMWDGLAWLGFRGLESRPSLGRRGGRGAFRAAADAAGDLT